MATEIWLGNERNLATTIPRLVAKKAFPGGYVWYFVKVFNATLERPHYIAFTEERKIIL